MLTTLALGINDNNDFWMIRSDILHLPFSSIKVNENTSDDDQTRFLPLSVLIS